MDLPIVGKLSEDACYALLYGLIIVGALIYTIFFDDGDHSSSSGRGGVFGGFGGGACGGGDGGGC